MTPRRSTSASALDRSAASSRSSCATRAAASSSMPSSSAFASRCACSTRIAASRWICSIFDCASLRAIS
jgi:hypothetical protein